MEHLSLNSEVYQRLNAYAEAVGVSINEVVELLLDAAQNSSILDKTFGELNQDFYRRLLNHVEQAVIVSNLDGKIIFWNRYAEQMYGWKASEVIGQPVRIIVPDEYLETAAVLMERFKAGESFRGDFTVRHRLGHHIVVSVTNSPIFDQNGNLVGTIGVSRDITAEKHTTQMQIDLFEQFKLAVDTAGLGVWTLDLKTNDLIWNDRLLEIYGISRQEFEDRLEDWRDLVHPDDLAYADTRMAEIFEKGEVYDVAFRIRRKDGQLRYLSASGVAIRDSSDEIVRLMGINIDVTEQKQVENALRESEARYKAMAEHYPNGMIALFDENLVYTLVGGKGLEQIGLNTDMLLGKRLRDIFPPEVYQRDEPALRAALSGEIRESVVEFGEKTFRIITTPVYNDAGQIINGLIVSQDITQLKWQENALRQSEQSFRALTEHNPDAITRVDREGKLLYANAAAIRQMETTEEMVINNLPDEFAPSRNALELWRQVTQQVFETGQEIEIEIQAQPTSDLTYDVRFVPEFDEAGQVQSILSIGRDITDRKESEKRLLELAVERERVRVLRDFIHDASHDLRTPLTLISTSLYLLRKGFLTEDQHKRVGVIQHNHDRLKQLLNGLFEMSELDLNAGFEQEKIDLRDLLSTLIWDHHPMAREKAIFVELDCPTPLKALGDEGYLYRVFANLLVNAIYYTPEAGQVTFQCYETDEDTVCVCVKDTGVGIAKKHLPHLFERFYRVDDARRTDGGGSGLGLAIVRKIVDQHNGAVTVESELGVGTTFKVTLPVG